MRPSPVPSTPPCRFAGPAYLQLEAEVDNPLDFSPLDETENRWNRRGDPTLYLASDPGVALAEFARHTATGAAVERVTRRIFRFVIDLDGLVDLRSGDPARFLDRDAARRTAEESRLEPGCRGLIVPSMAFLGEPQRCNLVIFVDKAGDPRGWVREVGEVGRLEISDAARTA